MRQMAHAVRRHGEQRRQSAQERHAPVQRAIPEHDAVHALVHQDREALQRRAEKEVAREPDGEHGHAHSHEPASGPDPEESEDLQVPPWIEPVQLADVPLLLDGNVPQRHHGVGHSSAAIRSTAATTASGRSSYTKCPTSGTLSTAKLGSAAASTATSRGGGPPARGGPAGGGGAGAPQGGPQARKGGGGGAPHGVRPAAPPPPPRGADPAPTAPRGGRGGVAGARGGGGPADPERLDDDRLV